MKYLKYASCGILIGLLNGIFASGGGVLAVIFLEKVVKLEKKHAHATAIAVILPISIVSIFFYTKGGHADFLLIIKTSIGGIIGGVIGAKLLNILDIKITKIIFGIILIFAAVRMMFK